MPGLFMNIGVATLLSVLKAVFTRKLAGTLFYSRHGDSNHHHSEAEGWRYALMTASGLGSIVIAVKYPMNSMLTWGTGAAGLFELADANVEYWRYMSDATRTALLGFTVIGLGYIAWTYGGL